VRLLLVPLVGLDAQVVEGWGAHLEPRVAHHFAHGTQLGARQLDDRHHAYPRHDEASLDENLSRDGRHDLILVVHVSHARLD